MQPSNPTVITCYQGSLSKDLTPHGTHLLACSLVCNKSWHLPWNRKLVWHPARLIKEAMCGSVCGYHASKRSLVLALFALKAMLFLPPFLLSPTVCLVIVLKQFSGKLIIMTVHQGSMWVCLKAHISNTYCPDEQLLRFLLLLPCIQCFLWSN